VSLSTNVLAALSKSVSPAAEAPLAQIDNVHCKARARTAVKAFEAEYPCLPPRLGRDPT
jgi:hypothetical protein